MLSMYDNKDYELLLTIPYPNLFEKQKKSLKKLLHLTSQGTGLYRMKQVTGFNIWGKIVEKTFFSGQKSNYYDDYAFHVQELVEVRICRDLESSIVLLNATYVACQKYKSCLQRIQYTSDKSLRNNLPVFTLKLQNTRQSMQPSWYRKDSSSDGQDYDRSRKLLAVKQTRCVLFLFCFCRSCCS